MDYDSECSLDPTVSSYDCVRIQREWVPPVHAQSYAELQFGPGTKGLEGMLSTAAKAAGIFVGFTHLPFLNRFFTTEEVAVIAVGYTVFKLRHGHESVPAEGVYTL